jgi:hypothetical protein
MEDCGLVELTDMVLEVLEGMSLQSGTVLLLSSISYLLYIKWEKVYP